jgi:hypothetical protein
VYDERKERNQKREGILEDDILQIKMYKLNGRQRQENLSCHGVPVSGFRHTLCFTPIRLNKAQSRRHTIRAVPEDSARCVLAGLSLL